MSIDAFVKRFSGGNSLGPALPFYHGANGVPQVILRFDAEKHVYYLVREDGSLEKQSGCTNILHIIDKSLHLMPWATKMMFEQLVRTLPTRTRAVDGVVVTVELPLDDFKVIATEAKSAHRNRLEDASDVGKLAHDCIERSIKYAIANTGGIVVEMVDVPTDERAASCVAAAHKWMKAHKVVWLETERKIYSRKYKVAGTLDGLAKVSSCDDYLCCPNTVVQPAFVDRLSIADWKSSNTLRTEHCAQVGIYKQAIQEELGIIVEDCWVNRLDKETGEFEPWHLTADTFAADLELFLCCLALVRAKEVVDDRMAAARKLRTAAKRAAKADEKRLAKDNERVAKALAKATKKAERDAEKLRVRAANKLQREAEKLLRQDAKKLAKETSKAERAARKAKKDDVPTYASTPEQPRHVQALYAELIAEATGELAPETNEYAPWVPDYIDFVLPLANGNTCRIKPTTDERWEIAAVIAGQKYRGTRGALADAFTAADALVKSKLGTQATQ